MNFEPDAISASVDYLEASRFNGVQVNHAASQGISLVPLLYLPFEHSVPGTEEKLRPTAAPPQSATP